MRNGGYVSLIFVLSMGSIEAMLPMLRAMQTLIKKSDSTEKVEHADPIAETYHNQEKKLEEKSYERAQWSFLLRVRR
jgi:hypothetical protein